MIFQSGFMYKSKRGMEIAWTKKHQRPKHFVHWKQAPSLKSLPWIQEASPQFPPTWNSSLKCTSLESSVTLCGTKCVTERPRVSLKRPRVNKRTLLLTRSNMIQLGFFKLCSLSLFKKGTYKSLPGWDKTEATFFLWSACYEMAKFVYEMCFLLFWF